ncbi:MAG: carboxylesterase/lipase family protein [Anaerocolumna sp.]|jgi:para-nitrobenzyl esterase|nr:carboxylesterase/lipase family protein [Anaerocolumna sp.]
MIVNTCCGAVKGFNNREIHEFRGIPYAKAKRFGKPYTFQWSGILETYNYGDVALQINEGKIIGSEDCLNLNIITPDLTGNLPVMVEIHGGAFQMGSNQGMIDGVTRKYKDYVHVAINYRLGVMGFLSLENLTNLGVLDQIAALEWIRKNIAFFGGDPEQITLFGNSAGAKSIGALMVSPYSRHLFNQVILSSGAIQGIRTNETAVVLRDSYLEHLSLSSINELFHCDVSILLEAQKEWCQDKESTCFFGPVIDGDIIPVNWEEELSKGNGFRGRAIIGSNERECLGLSGKDNFLNKIHEIAFELFGNYSKYAIDTFHKEVTQEDSKEVLEDKWVQIFSDYMYRTHSLRLARILSGLQQKVWFYNFTYKPADHALDIRILNGDYEKEQGNLSEDKVRDIIKIRETLEEIYHNFIVNKDPNASTIPFWEEYKLSNPKSLVIGKDVELKEQIPTEYYTNFPNTSISL